MPEYLAPGVYVEGTSFPARSIEGVSTTTTGFVGPTRYGPVALEPSLVTSLLEFECVYGDGQQLCFMGVDENGGETPQEPAHNYMWHAARAFFAQGGRRLYVARVFRAISAGKAGYASAWLPDRPDTPDTPGALDNRLRVRARFAGAAGAMRVRLTLRLGPNLLSCEPGAPAVTALLEDDVVWISDLSDSPPSPPSQERGDFHLAKRRYNPTTGETTWEFRPRLGMSPSSPPNPRPLSTLRPGPDPQQSDQVRVVTLTVTAMALGESQQPPAVWSGLALDPVHKTAGQPDSIFAKFAESPSSLLEARRLPIVIECGAGITDGIAVLDRLFQFKPALRDGLNDPRSTDRERSLDLLLEGGDDGQRPTADDYQGRAEGNERGKTGLKALEDIADISIVAAPGSTFGYESGYREQAATILSLLISHAELMRFRIAVLDSGDNQEIDDVRALRGRYDSKYAALYHPWVKILDPITQTEIVLPPSGFITGIYARNDILQGVSKASANEVINLAIGLEKMLSKSQQEVLHPEGVNCLRFFEGRGVRIWGGRTISADPEWQYVTPRRYFNYLEHSIDRGTRWAVFESNDAHLWAKVRRAIEDFLLNEFQSGALAGDRPENAFFVRCDRTTMTQNDLDNGQLVCLIGVAPLRPAEFVISRIGQWTADRKG